jgi:serine/threonine protein kinase
MFAFGVLLFRLLSGERPFPSNNQDVLKRNTIELRYNVLGKDWQTVSNAAKDLVRKLLINRQERFTAEQALDHRWFLERGQSVLRMDISQTMSGEEAKKGSRSRAFLLVRSKKPGVNAVTPTMLRFLNLSLSSSLCFRPRRRRSHCLKEVTGADFGWIHLYSWHWQPSCP